MTEYRFLKLVGLSILVMICIGIGVAIEVALYSLFIDPGKDRITYIVHAFAALPLIAGVIGFILFFLIVKYWAKKQTPHLGLLAFSFSLIYLLLDFIVILIIYPAMLKYAALTFIFANGAKFLGSILSYGFYRKTR